jgi:hypothetical protein
MGMEKGSNKEGTAPKTVRRIKAIAGNVDMPRLSLKLGV